MHPRSLKCFIHLTGVSAKGPFPLHRHLFLRSEKTVTTFLISSGTRQGFIPLFTKTWTEYPVAIACCVLAFMT